MSIAGASGLWKPHKQHLCLHQRSTGKKAGRRLTTTTPEGKFFFSVCRASSQRREVGVGVRGRKKADTDFDIVVVGAGIIGLTIANRILTTTNLSVAIVDAAQPCAGATGAGQGYLWMGHRNPRQKSWDLANRSKHLWEEFAMDLVASGLDPLSAIGWRNTGSLLVVNSGEEAQRMQAHVEELVGAGVHADYLPASAVREIEPALCLGDGGAALVPGDSQIDAALAVALLCKKNSAFHSQGRYMELLQAPVLQFSRSSTDGSIEVVHTPEHSIQCRRAVVMAAGAWSRSILATVAEEWALPIIPAVKPRKGHLLVLEGLPYLQLKHGLMEFEYTANYNPVQTPQFSHLLDSQEPDHLDFEISSQPTAAGVMHDEDFGVAMTASMDPSGHLLLGSSREFTGFDVGTRNEVLECIMRQASKFLPALADVSLQQAIGSGRVRTGLRPYVPDGTPLIGPVPGVPGLLLATGHEGSGLYLALGTAEMVVGMITGIEGPVNSTPYSPAGRLSF
ncbi:unnamed protein product [Sphagnum jensenii]|uniref:FAD-dependent oxidoreductase domain-containing protein 1 n=1 Tax=Sphagnum jensenii TaxID=128206 RepID=A0ABP0X1J5_9BRYO